MSVSTPPLPSHVQVLSKLEAVDFPEEWFNYSNQSHFWFEWRMRAFKRQLKSIDIPFDRPLKCIDIGCGAGILREQLESATNWIVDGADLNTQALARTKPGRGRTLYYNIFDQCAEMQGAYDCVFLFDVIEHIEPTGDFLQACLRLLKPGGWLFINVPALELLRSQYDTAAGHHRRYDRPMLSGEVTRFGMEVKDIRYWAFSLVPLLIARKIWFKVRRLNDTATIIRTGFNPPGPISHAILRAMLKVETFLIGKPPAGTSVLMAAQKK